MPKDAKVATEREAELEEMVAVLRQALGSAPARWVIQHHAYEQWDRDVREPALQVTR